MIMCTIAAVVVAVGIATGGRARTEQRARRARIEALVGSGGGNGGN